AESRLEHLVDLVGIASGLADVPGAAIDRALRDIADVGDESRIGEAGIVADDDRRQVVEILERLEIEDRVRRVADEYDGVGLQLLELENLTGDIRAVGVVGNLRADIDAGALSRLVDGGGDGRAVIRVLVDDGNRVDLAPGLLQVVEELGVGIGEVGRDRSGAENPFKAAAGNIERD